MSSPLYVCFPLVLFALRVLAQSTNEVDSLPIITRHPQSKVVAPQGIVTLFCEASGDNQPILFTHNGNLINENDPAYSFATDRLTINGVIESLQGEYVCLASNRVGNRTFTVASAPALVQLQVFEVTLLSENELSPHNVTTTVGQPAILNCASSMNTLPPPTFSWEVYTPITRPIDSSDNAIIGINGSLYVQKPTLEQGNMIFRCTVSSGGRVSAGYIRLIVEASSSPAPRPVILSGPMNIAVAVGTRQAEFECITGGSPILPVMWTASSPGPFFRTLQRGYRVVAFNQPSPASGLQPNSQGTITCSVSSLGEFIASLDFIEPPRIRSTLPGTTQVITYGDPLTLRCDSDSRSVSWAWFHNGRRLDQFTGPLLNISSLSEGDTGSYQCYVVNEAGIAHGSTYVQVQTISAEIQQDLPLNTIVYRNQPASLDCIATGAPPPSYLWLKDNIPLSDPFEINPTNGTLRISIAADVHNGQYRCLATNQIGERVIGRDETTTTLTVITATSFTQPPIPEPTLDIQLDTEDTLFCEVSSDSGSTLQFSWTKDGDQLVLDSPRVTYVDPSLTRNGSIRITRVTNEDAGLYTCTVMTTYNGIAAPTIQTTPTQVMVTASPVSPMITELSSPSPKSVQVIWSITSNLNRIQSFSIEIRPASSAETDSWRVSQRNANAVSLFTFDDLTPFTRYMVRVNASYINGEETSSEVKEVVTMEDLPGDSPKGVTTSAIAGSDTNLEIKWQPPTQPNGVITDYVISYRLEDSATSNQSTRIGSNATMFILKDLVKERNYVVRVAAVNSIGVGPFSDVSMAVTGSAGLKEPQGPFYQTVWFIVVIIVVVVVLIVTLVLFVLIVKYKRSHRRSTGKYHVRPQSGYFGGGGLGVGDMTDDVASDYLKRSTELNAFGSPTNSEALDAMLERETIATTLTDHSSIPFPSLRGTPQLPNGARYMGIGAPGYINPPSFQEAISRSRKGSRSSRPHSGASNTEASEWSASHNSKSGLVPGGYDDPFERKHFGGEVPGPNSSFSVQTFSDNESEMTDATEYSHLAGAGPFPRSYHHLKVQTQQNATLV